MQMCQFQGNSRGVEREGESEPAPEQRTWCDNFWIFDSSPLTIHINNGHRQFRSAIQSGDPLKHAHIGRTFTASCCLLRNYIAKCNVAFRMQPVLILFNILIQQQQRFRHFECLTRAADSLTHTKFDNRHKSDNLFIAKRNKCWPNVKAVKYSLIFRLSSSSTNEFRLENRLASEQIDNLNMNGNRYRWLYLTYNLLTYANMDVCLPTVSYAQIWRTIERNRHGFGLFAKHLKLFQWHQTIQWIFVVVFMLVDFVQYS